MNMFLAVASFAFTATFVSDASDYDERAFADAVSLCAVAANLQHYVNKEILLRAEYRWMVHGPVLGGGEECPEERILRRPIPDYKENVHAAAIVRDAGVQGKRAVLVYKGVVRVTDEISCDATTYCTDRVFEISELVAAKLGVQN
jgi:hypothetical protein